MRLSSRLALLCVVALVYSATPTFAPPPIYDEAQKHLHAWIRDEYLGSEDADHPAVHAPPPLRYKNNVRPKVERLNPGRGSFPDVQALFAKKMSKHHLLPRGARASSGNPQSIAEVNRDGLTFEPCQRKQDCKGSRFCLDFESLPNANTCAGPVSCICFPRDPVGARCKKSSDCAKGEVCAFQDDLPPICVSRKIVDIGALQEVPDDESTPGSASDPNADPPTEPAAPPSTGDPSAGPATPPSTGDPSTDPAAPPSTGDPSTDPAATPSIEGSEPSGDSGESAEMMEPSMEPSLEPSPESVVCIDATFLRHLSTEDLVFEKHAWATVLCDGNESCATGGHMVDFRGRPMRMNTYCSIVECVQRVMLVNSPRYSRGLQVKSNTDGLYFTAFAARYNTRLEESLLSVAVRAGL